MAFRNSTVSELRIVLLGENSAEISRVGNFILGRDAFDTESLHPTIELHSERASGNMEGRCITLINTPHLLNPQLSLDQVTARFEECLFLSAPGPHVFLLVLQSGALKKEDEERMRSILDGPWFMKYTRILFSKRGVIHLAAAEVAAEAAAESLHLVIRKSERGHEEQVVQLLEKIDELVRLNGGRHLTYNTNELLEAKEKLSRKESKRNIRMSFSSLKHVRIVLLGKNVSEISRVGNCILGRNAFDTETPPPSVEQHSERARGMVERRYITLINTPHLFNAQLSVEEVSLRVKECMTLCAPGPHAFLLVLQPEECTLKDWDQMKTALNQFSDTTLQYTAVLTTQKQGTGEDPHKGNQLVQEIVKKCGGRHYQFHKDSTSSDLLKVIDKVMKKNKKRSLKSRVHTEHRGRDWKKISKKKQKEMTRGRIHLTPSTANETKTLSEKLNLVLCGCDEAVKSSISDLILGQRECSTGSSSVCVRREGEVCGCLVTLVEMPALYNTQLSEAEVMQETHRCISLCDPGVHAFLLVIHEGRLTDEDKGEMEKIKRIFGSTFSEHTIVLITEHSQNEPLDESVMTVIENFGRRHLFFTNSSQVPNLIEQVKELLTKNRNQYTTETYLCAQAEIQQKYEREVAGLKQEMSELRKTFPLRIVLLGKTGAGKSVTGNTIFGREDLFKEDVSGESVTTVCQKETTEINDREVTVIDTPGLFDAPTSNINTRHEISKTITMAAPGPHAFLLVVPIGRHNQDVNEALKMIQNVFGDDSTRYTMVLFTRGDDLRKKSIEQFIENSGQHTKNLIGRCGNRYHVINNRNPDDRDQVTALLKKIDSMVAMNGGSCYTNEKFQQAEKALQEEQERTLKEKEEENKETEIMMTNIEIQRQQQLLWHRRQMLKRNVQQEHDGTLREGSPEETEKNPVLV